MIGGTYLKWVRRRFHGGEGQILTSITNPWGRPALYAKLTSSVACGGVDDVTVGKKVVRALYTYEPSLIADDNEAENDLCFNKGDVMIVIKEYVHLSVCLSVCLTHSVLLFLSSTACVCVSVCFFVRWLTVGLCRSAALLKTTTDDFHGIFMK